MKNLGIFFLLTLACLYVGQVNATDSGNAIVSKALQELGNDDDDDDCPASGCYGGNGNWWCSEFVSWVYKEAGYPYSGGWQKSNTDKTRDWFKANSTYITRSSKNWSKITPRPGDYVFIGRASDSTRKHSGIVERIDSAGTLHTIEGNNSGNVVARYQYLNYKTNSKIDGAVNGIVKGFGLRTGMNIRISNGSARASSAGNNRPPIRAFDLNNSTFWRNRTNQNGTQYLEMDFRGKRYNVTKVSLKFGSHYCKDYRFKFKKSNVWSWSTKITGNNRRDRSHVWFTPKKSIQAVRLYCLKYKADDYFSVHEMTIQK